MLKDTLEEFIKTVIQCLTESNIKYVILGGLAAILYGRPRTSIDVDDYPIESAIITRKDGFQWIDVMELKS